MSLSKNRFVIDLLPPAIIGAIFASGMVGLLESINRTINVGYDRWTLPFFGVGYYGILGIITGIIFGIVAVMLLMLVRGKLTSAQMFNISAAAAVIYAWLYPPKSSALQSIWDSRPEGLFSVLLIMGIVLLCFILFYFIFKYLYLLSSKISKHVLLNFVIVYFLILIVSGIMAFSSPEKPQYNKPYNENAAVHLQGKPNVLFILVDCLRPDYISPYGCNIETPAMQTLTDDGILFTKAFANSNWTKPATASIFSSLLPHQHGALNPTSRLSPHIPLLPELLSDNGYYSVGFSTNVNITKQTGFDCGFNEFYYLRGIPAIPLDVNAPKLPRFKIIDYIAVKLLPHLKDRVRIYRNGESTTNNVIKWLETNKRRKFFVYLHYMDTHEPYYSHHNNGEYSRPYYDGADEDNLHEISSLYKGEVTYSDKHISRLLRYLKDENLYDSTLVILTSDHGEALFEHYLWEHGKAMYDEMIWTPLIIKLPGSDSAGKIDSSLVSQLDYAPSIFKYLGFTPPETWKGQDIFSSNFHNEYISSLSLYGPERNVYRVRCIRTLDYKLCIADMGYSPDNFYNAFGIRIDERGALDDSCLFDLRNDPGEINNLYFSIENTPVRDSIICLDSLIISDFEKNILDRNFTRFDEETLKELRALGYIE
ncbi:MAG: sulfatase-like hydrolase/transferase [candidate division Zixibacteria bacterium]|nr:sulfatase-like hydrolase/transferase [candidate division Zixibacteria bacterium]